MPYDLLIRGARVLARYSRDLGLIPLPEAVRKKTGLSAANFGLIDRGEIREGAYADLTLFDLEILEDTADYAVPVAPARGIELVSESFAYHRRPEYRAQQ